MAESHREWHQSWGELAGVGRGIMVFIGSQSGRPSVREPHSRLTSLPSKSKFPRPGEKGNSRPPTAP